MHILRPNVVLLIHLIPTLKADVGISYLGGKGINMWDIDCEISLNKIQWIVQIKSSAKLGCMQPSQVSYVIILDIDIDFYF